MIKKQNRISLLFGLNLFMSTWIGVSAVVKSKCIMVSSWANFVSEIVNSSDNTILLCPFTIVHDGDVSSAFALPPQKTVVCQKRTSNDHCIIQGDARHLDISVNTLVGFTFSSSNYSAVSISDSSNSNILDCNFYNNIRGGVGNGGGIVMRSISSNSHLFISDSNFIGNSALSGNGGAIFTDGSTVTVVSSNFTNNAANLGGAFVAKNGSIHRSFFTSNKSKGSELGSPVDSQDGNLCSVGSNYGCNIFGTNTCDGINNILKCHVFETTCETLTPSTSPSLVPTFSPSMPPTFTSSTLSPSRGPSSPPTRYPTLFPSSPSSIGPTVATNSPSDKTSESPTNVPTTSALPTVSSFPAVTPSQSTHPSMFPTLSPSKSSLPTKIPSNVPTLTPTEVPSYSTTPTEVPSYSTTPTELPSYSTTTPSYSPSVSPFMLPSYLPSELPSNMPSLLPSISPTLIMPCDILVDSNDLFYISPVEFELRGCAWVAEANTNEKCRNQNVLWNCPITCNMFCTDKSGILTRAESYSDGTLKDEKTQLRKSLIFGSLTALFLCFGLAYALHRNRVIDEDSTEDSKTDIQSKSWSFGDLFSFSSNEDDASWKCYNQACVPECADENFDSETI